MVVSSTLTFTIGVEVFGSIDVTLGFSEISWAITDLALDVILVSQHLLEGVKMD